MNQSHTLFSTIALVVVGALIGFYAGYSSANADWKDSHPIKVRWLIAHEPVNIFSRAEETFKTEFNKYSDGKIVLEMFAPKDFSVIGRHLSEQEVFGALDGGKTDMSTISVVGLARMQPKVSALMLPFLFADLESAGKTSDSPAGQKLLSIVTEGTTARALAFTLSGGLEIIESLTKEIKDANDLRGLRIATSEGVIAEETLRALGAIPVRVDGKAVNGTIAAVENYDGHETTYTRMYEKSRYVSETHHRLFATSILVSDAFYDSLSPQNRTALEKAARAAAVVEREDSIARGKSIRDELIKNGGTVFQMSPSVIEEMKKLTAKVYDNFEKQFGSEIVKEIRSQL